MNFSLLRETDPELPCTCGHPINMHSYNVCGHPCFVVNCDCTEFHPEQNTGTISPRELAE